LGEQKSRVQKLFFARFACEIVRLKPTKNKDLPYVYLDLSYNFSCNVVTGYGPRGKSVPRAPRWQNGPVWHLWKTLYFGRFARKVHRCDVFFPFCPLLV